MADPRGGKWDFLFSESCKETRFSLKQHHEEQALSTEHTTKQQADSLAPNNAFFEHQTQEKAGSN